jgi:hypothetical protein
MAAIHSRRKDLMKLGFGGLLAAFAILAINGTSSAHIVPTSDGFGFIQFENACKAAGWEFDKGGPSGEGAQGSTCTHIEEIVQDDSVVVIERGASGRGWTLFETTTFVHVSTWGGPGPDGTTTVVTETTTTKHCVNPAGHEVSLDHPACQL